MVSSFSYKGVDYTVKTGTPVEDGDSVLKLLRGLSHPEIQLGMDIHLLWTRMETVFQTISKLKSNPDKIVMGQKCLDLPRLTVYSH